MRRNDERRDSRSGFTLVEVLLVVAILVTLAAVVVVSVGGRREEAMIGATRTSIGGIASALDLFEVDTGKFPAALQALVQNDGSPNWRGPYVRGGLPADAWGTAFGYTPKGDNTYEIRSAGPDRQMGSGDDITN